MRMMPAAGLLCSWLLTLAACGSSGPSGDEGGGEVVVFAAASLTEAFTGIGDEFEATHPDMSVTFSFAGSSTLAAQISQGAPADVFASANEEIIARAHDDGHVIEPTGLASNSLTIAVEAGNPSGIESLDDLTDAGVVTVLCAPEVPCGSLADEVLAASGIELTPSSYEADVKAVATKVALGEADAGLVYQTDVAAAGDDLESVPLPDGADLATRYTVATVDDGTNPAGADAFIDFATGSTGQEILATHGFDRP